MQVVSADRCFSEGLLPLRPDAAAAVAIMDRMLACEMTWQGGSALAQTVFTCLYCHRPDAIEDPVLRLYCEAMLKCCDITRSRQTAAAMKD
jgi:hypothetical protein